MKKMWEYIDLILGLVVNTLSVLYDKTVITLGVFVSYIFAVTGQRDDMIVCLLVFMTIDYATGLLKAVYNKKLNSKIGYRGFLKKILTLCVVVVAYRLDIILHLSNITYNCRFVTISFYIANEGLSILENCANAGIKVPKQLKSILEQCKEDKIGKGKE